MAAAGVFLQDMALVTVVAAVTTVIFHRLRQPVVLGYLLAGVLVGWAGSPLALVRDRDTIAVLGELGIVFLLFALGLDFNFRKLRKVGVTAIVAGLLETSLMIWLGYTLGRAFGFDHLESLFLGAIVSISSTTIIVKVLTELNQKDEEWAEVIFGILIVEDVLAVLILTLLSTAGASGNFSPEGALLAAGKLAIFLGSALVLGLVVVPRLVSWIARMPEEVLTITVLGLAFGMALLAGRLGFSTALGAFIMGALIAESAAAETVLRRTVPIRDLFTAIFFVTVGMLLDPAVVVANGPLILLVAGAVVVGKVVAASFATFVTGHEPRVALRVGFGLAQIGEFSFVIATLALSLGVTDAPLYAVAVAVSAITAFLSPALFRWAPRAAAGFEHRAPKPLRTYASLYGAWVRRLRDLGAADPARKRATRAGVLTALYGAVLVTFAAAGGASVARLDSLLAARVPLLANVAAIAAWTVIGVLVVPFVLLFGRSLRVFVGALADAALPERMRGSATGGTVEIVLRRTFMLAGVVLAASVLLVAASPFVPTGPLLVVVGVAVAASASLLYGALLKFHRRVEGALSGVLTGEARDDEREERSEILALIRESYPWEVEAKEVRVPSGSFGANRTLRDLALRSRTGATVVGMHRGEEHVTNPPPDAVILAGDVLVLMGEDAQVAAAASLVAEPAAAATTGAAEWREVRVAAGSPLEGETLAGARLRERTGATVVAVVRAGERIGNPPADLAMREGDVLLVVGAPSQVAGVEALARGRDA